MVRATGRGEEANSFPQAPFRSRTDDRRTQGDPGKSGLLELAKQLGNVSQACKILGYSRDSFYRFQEL